MTRGYSEVHTQERRCERHAYYFRARLLTDSNFQSLQIVLTRIYRAVHYRRQLVDAISVGSEEIAGDTLGAGRQNSVGVSTVLRI